MPKCFAAAGEHGCLRKVYPFGPFSVLNIVSSLRIEDFIRIFIIKYHAIIDIFGPMKKKTDQLTFFSINDMLYIYEINLLGVVSVDFIN